MILQPIEEYLREYRISEIVTFEYYGSFQDVNVIAPRFKKDISTEAEELEALVVLMKKYQVEIPAALRERQKSAKMLKEMKDTIRSFENWLVGYMIYLTLKRLEVDSIYYSPSTGFRICLSGKGIDPTTIKIKTCIVDI